MNELIFQMMIATNPLDRDAAWQRIREHRNFLFVDDAWQQKYNQRLPLSIADRSHRFRNLFSHHCRMCNLGRE